MLTTWLADQSLARPDEWTRPAGEQWSRRARRSGAHHLARCVRLAVHLSEPMQYELDMIARLALCCADHILAHRKGDRQAVAIRHRAHIVRYVDQVEW